MIDILELGVTANAKTRPWLPSPFGEGPPAHATHLPEEVATPILNVLIPQLADDILCNLSSQSSWTTELCSTALFVPCVLALAMNDASAPQRPCLRQDAGLGAAQEVLPAPCTQAARSIALAAVWCSGKSCKGLAQPGLVLLCEARHVTGALQGQKEREGLGLGTQAGMTCAMTKYGPQTASSRTKD